MEEDLSEEEDEKLSWKRTDENPQSRAETPGLFRCDSGELSLCNDEMLLSSEQVPSTSKKITVSIEGNIRAGKTTFLEILRD